MEYFNYAALALVTVAMIVGGLIPKKRPLSAGVLNVIESRRFELTAVGCILVVGALLRFAALSELPAGMNQDEASMGYDAWALANYGVDRNGYTFPVYPVAWGAGHGPFYVYLSMLFIKVFGGSLFVYRLPIALLGIASILILYLTVKLLRSRSTAYIAAFLLAVSPWHIMLSRWGLDANPTPFLVLLAVYFFVLAYQKQRMRFYILSAVSFALSLYAYASAYVVVPILMLISVFFAMKQRRLTVRQLLFSGAAFLLAALPLALFWIINTFHLSEVNTPFFSIPRLTAMRSDSVFLPFDNTFLDNVANNLGSLATMLFSYQKTEIYNILKGFNIIYIFTFPLMIAGAIRVLKRSFRLEGEGGEFVIGAWFISSFLYALVIHQNINRLSILFIPIIYFTAVGFEWLSENIRELTAVLLCLVIAGTCLFTAEYFGDEYRQKISTEFMSGLGEAAAYADSLDCEKVYCADAYYGGSIRGAYLILMYYCKVEPSVFYESVQYYNNETQFRYAREFGKYCFMIPENITSSEYNNDVFILPASDAAKFGFGYEIRHFDRFIVVRKASS